MNIFRIFATNVCWIADLFCKKLSEANLIVQNLTCNLHNVPAVPLVQVAVLRRDLQIIMV